MKTTYYTYNPNTKEVSGPFNSYEVVKYTKPSAFVYDVNDDSYLIAPNKFNEHKWVSTDKVNVPTEFVAWMDILK